MNMTSGNKEIFTGYEFSTLSAEDLKVINDTEQTINQHHNPKLCLIAYDKKGEM